MMTRNYGIHGTQYKVGANTWAHVESDGAVNVYTTDGSWLGWCGPDGTLKSTAGLDGSLNDRVYNAAQYVFELALPLVLDPHSPPPGSSNYHGKDSVRSVGRRC